MKILTTPLGRHFLCETEGKKKRQTFPVLWRWVGCSGGPALPYVHRHHTHSHRASWATAGAAASKHHFSASNPEPGLPSPCFGSLLGKVRTTEGLSFQAPHSSARLWFAPLRGSRHAPSGLDRPETALCRLYPRSLRADDQPPLSQLCLGSASILLLVIKSSWGSSWEWRSCGLETRNKGRAAWGRDFSRM